MSIIQKQPRYHALSGKTIMTETYDGMDLDSVMIRLALIDKQIDKMQQRKDELEQMKDAIMYGSNWYDPGIDDMPMPEDIASEYTIDENLANFDDTDVPDVLVA